MGSRLFGGPLRVRLGLIALAALMIWTLLVAPASADRAFDDRFSTNDTGDIEIAANTVVSCSPALATNCAEVRSNTGTTTTYLNNNFQMRYVDVDSNGTTFNSSSADLNLPNGSTVLFAGLYWGGQLNAGGGTGGGGQAAAPTPADNDVVLLDAPDPSGYSTINGAVDTSGSAGRYGGFAEVTDEVAAAGSGSYTVANVQTATGSDVFGGWSLVVAYRDTSQPARNLTVFDGLVSISGTQSANIPVSGFLTPPTGPVQTKLGLIAYEGDFPTTGDYARLDTTNIADALNPGGSTAAERNTFNSTIGKLGTRVTTKNPDYVNQLGYDADLIDANGILANNATSANIRVSTTGDAYLPAVVTFATELFAPDIQPQKSATDVNGGALEPGDELEYMVRITNTGDDAAAGVVVRDAVPTGTTFVPGSLQLDNVTSGASCDGGFSGRTDASDSDTAEFDGANNRTVFRMGDGATDTAGGTLDPDETQCARFRVVVDDDTQPDFEITNSAEADYRSATLGTAFVGVASNETDHTVQAPDLTLQKSHTGGPFVGGQSYDFNLLVSNIGSLASSGTITVEDDFPASSFASINDVDGSLAGWDCSASSGLHVECTFAGGVPQNAAIPEIIVNATLVGSPPPTITNTACVSGGNDNTPANNCGSDSGGATGQADLAITKVANPTTVFAGDQTTYEITVENLGPSTATDVQMDDIFGSDFTAVSATPSQGTCSLAVSCDLGSLASGDSATITVVATAEASAAGTTFTNFATVEDDGGSTDPVPENNNDQVDVDVPLTADLGVDKDFSPAAPEAGDPVTWAIDVTNNGPNPASNVTVVDTVPAEIADTPTPSATVTGGGTCDFEAGPPRTITCVIPSLGSGDSETVEVTGTLLSNSGGRTVRNTATVSADEADRNLDNNADSAAFQPLPFADLDVIKLGPANPVEVGQEFNYTLQAQNLGPSDAYGVDLVDTLPAGLQFVSSSNPDCSAAGQIVTCPLGTPDASQGNERVMEPGDSATFTIRALVTPAAAAGPSVTNLVELEQNPDDPTSFPPTPDPVLENNSDQVTTPVTQSADLAITKVGDPDPVAAGEDLTYTLTVTNNGPSAATSVEVADDLPASLTLVSAMPEQGSCNAADPIDCDLGTIASGDSVEIDIVATVGAGQAGNEVSNTASVDGAEDDPEDDNNSATETVDVAPEADLSIAKTDDPDPVGAGDDLTYVLTVNNDGPNDATDVEVSDDLPDGLTFVSATPSQGSCNTSDPVDCDLGTIANGGDATVTIVATVSAAPGSQLSNTASVNSPVEDPDPDDNSDTETTDVAPKADLSLTKVVDPDPVAAGENLTFTLTVANGGPNDATDVEVADDLPASLTLVSATPEQGSCNAADPVDCDLGTIANGDSVEIVIVATVGANQAGNTISNTASVTSPVDDPDPDDNEDTTTLGVEPEADLAITKAAGPGPFFAGDNVIYTLTVTNDGPNAATNVEVSDDLPASLTLVSATPDQGICNAADPVDCDLGSIASGDSAEVEIVATIAADQSGSQIANTASVAGAEEDPDETNNSDEETIGVEPEADLSITKTADPDPVAAGENVTYRLTVTNDGPSTATGVEVSDDLPASLTLVSATPDQGTCNAADPVDCDLGSIASGDSAEVEIVATVGADQTGQVIANTASVQGDEDDPDPSDNQDTEEVEATPEADLSITKSVSPNRAVRVGELLTYTLTVQNAGPNDATDVAVNDELGRDAALISVSPSQGSCAVTAPIDCDLGTIPNGGSAEVIVEVRPLERGRLVNGASVTSAMADPDESDNEDEVATGIRRARVRIDKVADARKANVGDVIRYEIRVRSSSPVKLENLRVCDRVPRALDLIGAPGARIKGGKACWRFDLPAGTTRTFEVRAKVKSVEHDLKVVNTARLKGPDVESAKGRDGLRVGGEPDSGVGPAPCRSVRGLRC